MAELKSLDIKSNEVRRRLGRVSSTPWPAGVNAANKSKATKTARRLVPSS